MNQKETPRQSADAPREETMAALFGHMVLQQTNMALMLLGKVAHPQTGEAVKDLEAARLFIDQLEMLQHKTRGNLSKPEEDLLKQSLMSLQMAFVEAAESAPAKESSRAEEPAPEPAAATGSPQPARPETPPEPDAPAEEEHRKKFVKKY